jgi:ADP-heptose:LPS heptosyltransferase
MGMGDEMIASGQVIAINEKTKRRVQIIGLDGAARWHPVWENNPRIARPQDIGHFDKLVNGGNARPYILAKAHDCWIWRDFKCVPGEIYLSDAEKRFGASYKPQIIVEPTIKARASPNKQWGWERWQEFAILAHAAGFKLTQISQYGTTLLPYARYIATPDFRHACAVLANAKAYVGHEGGLHHAAAAFNVPAVVIFGGFISPAQTGYDMHRNLFTGGKPCGQRIHCEHCAKAMELITPKMVLDELKGLF